MRDTKLLCIAYRCIHKRAAKYCECSEIRSFCASHIAAFTILACSLVLFIARNARRPDVEGVFVLQTALLLAILILWYFFGALSIEETFIRELRGMPGWCAWLELGLRVLLFVILELSEVVLSSDALRPHGVT